MTNGHNNNKICPILSAYANNLYICEKERCAFYIRNNNNEGCAITLLAKGLLAIKDRIGGGEDRQTDTQTRRNQGETPLDNQQAQEATENRQTDTQTRRNPS